MHPALSVIIACHNASATLAIQLAALAAQTAGFRWDVLVCDNGSTDDTVAIAEAFRDRIPSLRVINAHDRAGPGHARNVGAASTRAPLLAFCDADDEVAPGWVAAMGAGLREHQFIAGRFDAHRLNAPAVVRSRPLQQADGLQHSPFGPDLPHAGGGNLGVHRSVFFSVGGFDPAVTCLEDTDLCWRIQLSGVPLVFWPSAVLHVRLRSSLRAMWGQGRSYGSAAALLTHRYPAHRQLALVPPAPGTPMAPRSPGAPGAPGAPGTPVAPGAPAPGRDSRLPASLRPVRSLAGLAGLVGERRGLGGILWSLGWHAGHRSWRPEGSPAVPEF